MSDVLYRITVFAWPKRKFRAAVHASDGSQWEGPLLRTRKAAQEGAEAFVASQKALPGKKR